MSDDDSKNLKRDDDTVDDNNTWHKNEVIPLRFDELQPGPDWTPVADVIKSQREETGKQEAEDVKIKPPSDNESELEEEGPHSVQRVPLPSNKDNIKSKYIKEGSNSKTNISHKDAVRCDEEVDTVTQSMMKWALSTDYEMRKGRNTQDQHDQQPNMRDSAAMNKEQSRKALSIPSNSSVRPRDSDDKYNKGHTDASPRYTYSPHLRTSRFADDYKEKKSRPKYEPEPDYTQEYRKDIQKREHEHYSVPERYHRGHKYYSVPEHYHERERNYYTKEGYYHEREREYYGQARKYQYEEKEYYQKQEPYYYEKEMNYQKDQQEEYWNRGKDYQRHDDLHHTSVDQYQDNYHDDPYHEYRKGNPREDFIENEQYSSLQEYNVNQLDQDVSRYDPNQYYMGEEYSQYPAYYNDREEYMGREPQ